MEHREAGTSEFYNINRWVTGLNGLAVLLVIGVVYFTIGISWRLVFDPHQLSSPDHLASPYNAFGIPGHWTDLYNTLAFIVPTLLLLIATARYAKAIQYNAPHRKGKSLLVFLLLAFAIFQLIALLYSSAAMFVGMYRHNPDISIFYKALNSIKMALISLSWAAIFYGLYLLIRFGNGPIMENTGQPEKRQQSHGATALFSRIARLLGIASIAIGVFRLAEPLLLKTLPVFASLYPAPLYTSDQLSLSIVLRAATAISAGALLIALGNYFRTGTSKTSAILSKMLFLFSVVLLAPALLDHVFNLYIRFNDEITWRGGAVYELAVNALPEIATAAIFATFAVIIYQRPASESQPTDMLPVDDV